MTHQGAAAFSAGTSASGSNAAVTQGNKTNRPPGGGGGKKFLGLLLLLPGEIMTSNPDLVSLSVSVSPLSLSPNSL